MHIRDSGGVYGAERVILGASAALRKFGADVTIMSILDPSGAGEHLIQVARKMDLNVCELYAKHSLDARAVANLREQIKVIGPDILHAHDLRSALFALLSSKGLAIHTVATAHGSTRESVKKRFYLRIFESFLLPRFDRVHAVSSPLAAHLRARGVPPEKIRVVPNGVDEGVTRLPDGPNPFERYRGEPTLCAVGRLTQDKGFLFLIEALSHLKEEFPRISLVLAGDGPQEEILKAATARLKMGGSIHFCGRVENISWVYEVADILVIPSVREGLPCVLLEAMLSGLPVVATAVGSIPEVLNRGALGTIIRPRDSVALTQGIRNVIRNMEFSRSVALKAKQVAQEKYSAQAMARGLLEIYEGLSVGQRITGKRTDN